MYISSKNDEERSIGVARRYSGRVDFYFDYEFIDQSLNLYERFEMTTRYIFLVKKGEPVRSKYNDDGVENIITVLEIDMNACQRIGEQVGEPRDLDNDKWEYVIYDKIRNHCRLFGAITLININFFIAFRNIVAINDVVSKTWLFHSFKDDKGISVPVSGLLRNQVGTASHELNVGVLLQNGEIMLIDR